MAYSLDVPIKHKQAEQNHDAIKRLAREFMKDGPSKKSLSGREISRRS